MITYELAASKIGELRHIYAGVSPAQIAACPHKKYTTVIEGERVLGLDVEYAVLADYEIFPAAPTNP